MSRLATALRRIRFVILRTAGSPPVAPHPALRRRSYLQLRSPRPAPARTSTVLTKRPHGRTHARESGHPEPAPGLSRGANDAAPEALGPRFRARACTHLAAKVSLSALGGGEGRGEVGEPARSQRRHGPPHPPAATAPGPSLSPRKRAERGKGSR